MEQPDFLSFQSQKTNSIITESSSSWDFLGPDLTELIVSYLPIPSIVRAASVCKSWNSVIHSHSFKTRASNFMAQPWLFLSGQNKNPSNNNQVFAFDPQFDQWIKLPYTNLPSQEPITASNGFFFTTCSGKLSFKRIFSRAWQQTSPLLFSRCNPLIGAYNELNPWKPVRFIVVGETRPFGTPAQDCLAVEIYSPHRDSWKLCASLPEIFRPGNSLQLLCSALYKQKLYILSIYSGFISSFDLKRLVWSDVQTLRPPGVLSAYLIACRDQLVLAGLCSVDGEVEFTLWRVDETTLEFSEIGMMPRDFLSSLVDREGCHKFESLKCVGSGDVVFVLNEERKWNHQPAAACVCEISSSGKCRWRRVPDLPESVNKFDKVISFCSDVRLMDVLGNVGTS